MGWPLSFHEMVKGRSPFGTAHWTVAKSPEFIGLSSKMKGVTLGATV